MHITACQCFTSKPAKLSFGNNQIGCAHRAASLQHEIRTLERVNKGLELRSLVMVKVFGDIAVKHCEASAPIANRVVPE